MRIPPLTYGSREQILRAHVRGRRVLHLGCVGDRALNTGEACFHEVLALEAGELWGVDLNRQGLEELEKRMPDFQSRLLFGDACQLSKVVGLIRDFDVIVAGDIIEHLTNPAALFDSCRPLLNRGGRLLISTPNALSLLNVLRSWRGYEQVNPSHTCWFSFATMHELTRRLGWEVEQYFTCYDHENHTRWQKITAGMF